jgi:hypothetical protein
MTLSVAPEKTAEMDCAAAAEVAAKDAAEDTTVKVEVEMEVAGPGREEGDLGREKISTSLSVLSLRFIRPKTTAFFEASPPDDAALFAAASDSVAAVFEVGLDTCSAVFLSGLVPS